MSRVQWHGGSARPCHSLCRCFSSLSNRLSSNGAVVVAGQSLCRQPVENRDAVRPRSSLAGCRGDCKLLFSRSSSTHAQPRQAAVHPIKKHPVASSHPGLGIQQWRRQTLSIRSCMQSFLRRPLPPADARQAIFQCLKGPRGGSRVSAGRAVVWEKPALILWSELVALWSEPVASDTWSPVVLP